MTKLQLLSATFNSFIRRLRDDTRRIQWILLVLIICQIEIREPTGLVHLYAMTNGKGKYSETDHTVKVIATIMGDMGMSAKKKENRLR